MTNLLCAIGGFLYAVLLAIIYIYHRGGIVLLYRMAKDFYEFISEISE